MDRARIFWAGRSQAVRLPKEYRFRDKEVRIRRQGSAVILEPVPDDWQWLDAIAGKIEDDFAKAVSENPGSQDRPDLDALFR